MRVTVTGGAGFIGSALCRALAPSHEVVVIDDLSTGRKEHLVGLPHVHLVEASLLDADALDEAVDGADAVVHLAARGSVPRSLADPVATHEVNASGTLVVLEAARARGLHTVVASSSSVYGDGVELPRAEHHLPAPLSPYAASKLAAEHYATAYSRSYGLPVLSVRLFNVFGPRQRDDYSFVVPAFIRAALAGRPLTIEGDGHQTRDFTYVDSVAALIADAIHRRVTSPTPVNLAFGTRVSLLDVIGLLEGILDRPLERRHTEPRTGDVRDTQADQTRFRELFPEAQPVALETGLRSTVDWFRRA